MPRTADLEGRRRKIALGKGVDVTNEFYNEREYVEKRGGIQQIRRKINF